MCVIYTSRESESTALPVQEYTFSLNPGYISLREPKQEHKLVTASGATASVMFLITRGTHQTPWVFWSESWPAHRYKPWNYFPENS